MRLENPALSLSVNTSNILPADPPHHIYVVHTQEEEGEVLLSQGFNLLGDIMELFLLAQIETGSPSSPLSMYSLAFA